MRPLSFLLLSVVFTGIVFTLFFQTIPFPFTNYDDDLLILENRKIHQPSGSNIQRILWGFEEIAYQPIQDLSFMFDYFFWGAKHPEGFRITNLLLYVLNVLLFFVLAKKLLNRFLLAGVATLLFAVHPTHVESIVWIAGRKDLLAGFFGLGSFLCWLRFEKQWQLLALCFFILALGSKPNMVFLPLLGHLYLRLYPQFPKKTLGLAWGVTLPFFILFYFLANKNQAIVEYHGGNAVATFYTMSAIYLDYAQLFFWPASLSHYYEPQIYTQLHWKVALGAVAFLLSVAFFLWSWKKRHPACFFVGCFLMMMLPYSNILPISVLLANRYLYFSSMGLFLGIVFLLRHSRALMLLPGIAILWGIWSYQHSFLWQSSAHLWEQALQRYPQSEKILASLGAAYLQKAIPDREENRSEWWKKATPLFQQIVKQSTEPGNRLRAFFNLGVMACAQQEVELAYRYFESAEKEIGLLKERPLSRSQQNELKQIQANIYCSKGDICIQSGDLTQAAKCYRQAIQEFPLQAQPYVTLAVILSKTDRLSEAYQELDRALEIDPVFVSAVHTKGILLMSEPLEDPSQAARRDQKAKKLFERVLELQPDHLEANFQLAMAVQPTDLKRFEHQLRKVLELDPDFRDAHRFLLRLYLQKVKVDASLWNSMKPHVDFFQKRVTTDPTAQEEMLQYYSILANSKRAEAERLKQEEGVLSEKSRLLWEEAGSLFSSVLKIKTDSIEAYYGKAECALGLEDTERALHFLHQIQRFSPQEYLVLRQLGRTYMLRQEYLQAIYYFKEYQKQAKSEDIGGRYIDDYFISSLQQQMEEKVGEECSRARELLKSSQKEDAKKKLEDARNHLNMALKMNPKHPESNYLLSRIAHAQQLWKEELYYLEIAMSSQEIVLPPQVFYDLGLVCLRLEQPDRAQDALEKFQILVPQVTEDLRLIVLQYLNRAREMKSQKMQQAKIELQEAIQALKSDQEKLFIEKTEAIFKRLPYSPELKILLCKELLFHQQYSRANEWLHQEMNERMKNGQTQSMALPVLDLAFLDRERFPVVFLLEAYYLLENPTETNILRSKFFLVQIQKVKDLSQEHRSLIAQLLNEIKESSTRNVGKIRDQIKAFIDQMSAGY
ncbi:MAG: tetratricopeptide repeat protein [Planctomycetota bacterium]